MRYVAQVAAAGWLVSAAVQGAQAAPIPPDLKNDQIEIDYVVPGNPALRPIYDKLKQREVLEELRAFMAPLNLTRKLEVKTDQCGRLGLPYVPGKPVTICYELVAEIERLAPKQTSEFGVSPQAAVAGAFTMIVLHDMAYAVFDILNVPIWGRADDAADRLAGFIMLQFGPEVALTTLRGTAHFFDASKRTWTGNDFADVRSPEAQRYYNYLCLAAGGPTSEAFKPFLAQTKFQQLPRFKQCPKEYADLKWAFEQTIAKHVDPDLLRRVQAMDIFSENDRK